MTYKTPKALRSRKREYPDRAAYTGTIETMERKIYSAEAIAQVFELRRPLVFTNGVFDLLHRGHVTYLAEARALGAALLVAVNTDTSVRMLAKGEDRPLNTEMDRAFVLAALASVDYVTFFSERTPVELMKIIRPDIYVKGGDYNIDTLEETHLVRSWGGQAYALPFVTGYSTTALATRIKRSG